MSVMRLKNGKWRLQIRRKTLKLDELYDSEAEARAAEAQALGNHVESGQITLRQLWARYCESALFEDKSENTRKTEATRIKPVLEYLGDCTPQQLADDPGPIYDFIEARRKVISERTKKKLSNTSRRLEIAALASLVEYAKHRRLVRENYVSHISRPAGKRRKRRMSPEEQGKLSVYCRNGDERIAQAARFLLLVRHLGCRPGELCELLLKNVRLDAKEVLFPDTKNHLDRVAHVTSDAAALLHLQLAVVPVGSPYLFSTWSKEKCWVKYNYSHGITLLREAGVIAEDLHSHAGRREFVSRSIESGLPILTIKQQTGHKSTQALEEYDEALSTAPEVREALDNLAEKVKRENLMGAFAALGMTPEQREKMLHMMGQDGWVAPFRGKD